MKVALVVCVSLVLFCGGALAAEARVYPVDTTWTGGVFYIPSWPYWGFWWENPITWGNFFWMTTPCNERGFARYDLSSIPDGATVTSAVVHYFVYWDTLSPATDIRLLDVEPRPDSEDQAQEVYEAIAAGVLVAQRESTDAGWNSVELSSDGCRAIEQKLVTTDWLGLGWVYPGTDSADAVARGWRQDSTKTYVTVTYEMVGVGERAPLPPRKPAVLNVVPNPARDGRVRVSFGTRPELPGNPVMSLCVLDVSGRTRQSAVCSSESDIALDLRSLPPGVYTIEVGQGNLRISRRLVLAR